MSKFVSSRNPISARALKRRSIGAVVRRHNGYEDVKFTRVTGGWRREREDFVGLSPEVVPSSIVARECNLAMGCSDSWAKVY